MEIHQNYSVGGTGNTKKRKSRRGFVFFRYYELCPFSVFFTQSYSWIIIAAFISCERKIYAMAFIAVCSARDFDCHSITLSGV